MKRKYLRVLLCMVLIAVTVFMISQPAHAAGDVASAIEKTCKTAQTQVKSVVNNVVFPVIDMILAILFFVKLGTAYFDYRKHGQFEFTAPAILFACLILPLPHRFISGRFYKWGERTVSDIRNSPDRR